MSKDTSGSAFPRETDSTHSGLTKREWYAGLAMQGLLANPQVKASEFPILPELSFKLADAMIAEGSK